MAYAPRPNMDELLTRRGVYREMVVAGNRARTLALIPLVFAACKAPEPPPQGPATAQARTTSLRLGSAQWGELAVDPDSETARVLAPGRRGPPGTAASAQARHNLWDRPSRPSTLLRPIEGARLVREGGTDMVAALAALPEARRALGVSALTPTQLFGPTGDGDGLCQSPQIDFETTLDGTPYEARYRPDQATLLTKPEPVLYALSSTCTAALSASAGAIASAVGSGCSREDEAAHFATGSTCRACLAMDGDHARCLASRACPAQTARTLQIRENGRNEFMDVYQSTVLACAPDYLSTLMILTHDRPDSTPDAFDHTQVTRTCAYYWSNNSGAPALNCTPDYGPVESTLADLLIMRVQYIRRPGETRTPLRLRIAMASRMELEGLTYEAMVLHPGTLGEISEPDVRIGGYGLAPNTLRADGTDLTNIDHTRARDWLGALALKTTTTINGVPFALYNKNLCPPGDWRGPDSMGRFHCRTPYFSDDTNPAPQLYDWQFDYGGFYTAINPVRIEMFPAVTLGATGRIDERIPGGHLPYILGTPVLADPEWENCAWPDQFTPDEQTAYDIAQPGTPTFTMQTYRFGKDPRQDIRVVLATNWRRGFCFEDL